MILTRNLLYTAVTRARNMAVLVGSRENIARMVGNNFTARRYTLLRQLLTAAEAKERGFV
jgi:exodeoxyribonuclease V alpha subunit